MTTSARKELEKTLKFILSEWPVDVPCEPTSEYLTAVRNSTPSTKEQP